MGGATTTTAANAAAAPTLSEGVKGALVSGLIGVGASAALKPKSPSIPKAPEDNSAALASAAAAAKKRREQGIASSGLAGTYKTGPLGIVGGKTTLGGS